LKPASNNSLVETKVTPQTVITKIANKWVKSL